jgi:aminoglycoside 6'-N-acetyltransferase I
MNIREAKPNDLNEWAHMRNMLWPNSVETHKREIEAYFDGESIDIVEALILENNESKPIGFIEINIRNFAEGSSNSKIPYIEAWYVSKKYQGKGNGKALMSAAEKWAIENGYKELASDTEISNTQSIEIHKKLGFKETERVVCFLKKLT